MSRTLAAIAIACAFAAPAIAETSSFAFRFSFDPARLATAEGAAQVYSELQVATANACRKAPPSAQRGVDSACREGLMDAAVRRIQNTQINALHFGASRVAAN